MGGIEPGRRHLQIALVQKAVHKAVHKVVHKQRIEKMHDCVAEGWYITY